MLYLILCQMGISFTCNSYIDTSVLNHYQKATGYAKHNCTTETPFCHKTYQPNKSFQLDLEIPTTLDSETPTNEIDLFRTTQLLREGNCKIKINKSQIYLKSISFSPKKPKNSDQRSYKESPCI